MSETKFIGFTAFEYLLDQMNKDFGVKDARKNVLIPAAKNAMKIVLEQAKNNLYVGHGLDTGQLKRTLQVSARPVRNKDLRSKYVKQGDVVIATVSAKLNVNDISDARAMAVEFGTKNRNTNVDVKGMSKRSALAVQREFGTVRMAARPYLRPAMESKQTEVTEKLNQEIKVILDKYKSKQAG